MSTARPVLAAGLLVMVTGCASGCQLEVPSAAAPRTGSTPAPADFPAAPAPAQKPVSGTDAQVLAHLVVKPAGSMRGYDRDKFGQRWSDDVTVAGGHNGCDTRNDTLRAQLRDPVIKPGTHGCVVLSGALDDPYTGQRIHYVRAGGKKSVDIDHAVALGNAWRSGAATWPKQRRQDLANDPANLLAVDAGANRSKGDRAANEWLPEQHSARCAYVRRQAQIKARYGLTVTYAELTTMRNVIQTHCQTR